MRTIENLSNLLVTQSYRQLPDLSKDIILKSIKAIRYNASCLFSVALIQLKRILESINNSQVLVNE